MYCCEALGLGLFMFFATLAVIVIEYPTLPVYTHIHSDLLRLFLVGLCMGITAFFILTSSFGKRSGAHINPSVTIIQYRLGNLNKQDAIFYILFQFIGGTLGMLLIFLLVPTYVRHPSVNFIVTQPGDCGVWVAFILEFLLSFILMATVLYSNSDRKLSKYTAYFVAALLMVFITFEAPFSGMSINPARSFASCMVSGEWKGFWIYCIAPPLGMIAGELFITKVLKRKLHKVTLQDD